MSIGDGENRLAVVGMQAVGQLDGYVDMTASRQGAVALCHGTAV